MKKAGRREKDRNASAKEKRTRDDPARRRNEIDQFRNTVNQF